MNEIVINTPNIIKGVREYKFSTSNYSDSVPFVFVSSYIEMIAGKTYTVGVRCKEVDEGQCVWGRLNGTTHGKVTFGLFKDKAFSVYTIETGDGSMYHTDGITSVVKTYYNGMMCLTITPSVSGKYYLRIDLTAISSESKPWVRNLYDFTAVEGNAINIIAPVTAQAEHTQELMKSDEVKLSWSDTVRYDLPMGSNITVNGKTYYLYEPHSPITTDNYEWKYTPNFQSEIIRLGKTPFMLYTLENDVVKSVESDWNFTGDKEAIKIALEDAILRGTGLSYTVEIDEAIDKALIMSFSNVDIITALNNICKDWECEWWYDNNVITITKRYVVGDVIEVTDGVEVQGTTTKTQNTFYNRFYVFGSDRNISQDYNGAQATQVVNKRLTLDPAKHSGGYIDLPKFDSEGNVLVDANGDYITDDSVSSGMIFSKVITIEDVYPKSDLSVQSICTRTKYMRDDNDNIVYLDDSKTTPDTYKVYYITLIDGVGDMFTINPSTYDKDKNPNGSLIKGKELSLHMKSGALSGREFKLIYHEQSETLRGDDGVSVTIPAHCFEVVFIQDNTVIVPNTNIAPKVGDKAIIFNIRMPQMYIDSAYRELEEKALLAIYEESRDRNAYTVKSNQVYFAENNPQFVIGSNVLYTVGGRDLVTRVTKLVTKLDRAYEQTITFCKELSKGSISTIVEAIESTERHVTEVSVKDDRAVQEATRKAFKAQQELKDMVFDTDGYFDGGKIKPETIETLMLSVGAMSTNFALQNVLFEANYNTNANSFNVLSNSGKLIHYAIDPDNIKTWNVTASTRTDLVSATAYYVYAQCAVSGTACNIVLSTEQYKYNALVDSNNVYMFLIGTLSSVMRGDNKSYRILSLTYGATTINGGQLKTGRISSTDGKTYFDLDTGEISGQISFKGSSDYTEILGDIAKVGSVANSAQKTANTANKNAQTANENANKAITTAEQVKDLTITNVDVEYAQNQSTTTAPTSGWSTNAPAWKSGYYIWQRTATTYGAGTTEYSTPTCISGRNGVNGIDGKNGANGADGAKGDTGVGVDSIVEQYYLSTSETTQTGGSWSTAQPEWASGKYIWTRSVVTYDDRAVQYTTPVLAKAINKANSTANTANNTANTAKTTADSANSKVDNLQIGGKNLYKNTADFSGSHTWINRINHPIGSTVGYFTPTLAAETFMGNKVARSNGMWQGFGQDFEVQPNTQYTISMWVRANSGTVSSYVYYNDNGRSSYTSGGAITFGTEWRSIVFTFTTTATATKARVMLESDLSATWYISCIKVEKGNKPTDWSPGPEDVEGEIKAVQAQAEAMEYLKKAMTQGSTDINGGLVLTNVVQLKDQATDDVVAGVCGSDDVRFWSGGTLAEALQGIANFIVNSQGVLKAIGAILNNAQITSGETNAQIQLSDGAMKLLNSAGIGTELTYEQMTNVSSVIANMGASTTNLTITKPTTATAKTNNTTLSNGHYALNYPISVTANYIRATIASGTLYSPTKSGQIKFTSNLTVSTSNMIPTVSVVGVQSSNYSSKYNFNVFFSIYSNGVQVWSMYGTADTASDTVTIPLNGQVVSLQANKAYTYQVYVEGSITTTVTATSYPNGATSGSFRFTATYNQTLTATPQNAVTATLDFSVYNNKFYSNGLMFSKGTNSYIAMCAKPTTEDNILMQLRKGNAIYKMLANTGLQVSYNGGTSFSPVNPIALVVRLTYSGGGYGATALYNPYGKTVRATRSTTGTVKLEHNLGTTNYTICGVGVVSGNRVYISMYDIQQNYCYITMGDDNSPNDYNADITFIRY